jgi:uncharacterized Fe-S cluster-containing radical SAM superfamily protein
MHGRHVIQRSLVYMDWRFLGGAVLVYDAVERHLTVEKLVTRFSGEGLERKYYRFRRAHCACEA